jgi:hypothetical protein
MYCTLVHSLDAKDTMLQCYYVLCGTQGKGQASLLSDRQATQRSSWIIITPSFIDRGNTTMQG